MVVLRIIYTMFVSLKLRCGFVSTSIFYFEITFYQCTSYISTDMEIVTTFLYLIGTVAHINVPSMETFVLCMKALMSKRIQ